MKTNCKNIIWVLGLMLAMSIGATAQEFEYEVGDSVKVQKETTHYMTGERLPQWVYDSTYVIRQVDSRWHKGGVLLKGIKSWILADGVYPTNPEFVRARTAAKRGVPMPEPEPIVEPEPVVEPEPAPIVEPEPEPIVEPEPEPQPEPKPEPVKEKKPRNDYNRLSIGGRAGAAALMHDTKGQGRWMCGYELMLDLQYGHYWTDEKANDWGLIIGAGVGLAQGGLQMSIDTLNRVSTQDGDIDYRLKVTNVKETDKQLQLEIPVLFSFISNTGAYMNIGPKVQLPMKTSYKQTLTEPMIDARFVEENVHVTNEAITGMVSDEQLKTSGQLGHAMKFNVLLNGEVGYEWKFTNGNSLGLGAYADYCVWSSYKGQTGNVSLLQVTPPAGAADAVVSVKSASETYSEKMGYFDAGVKVTYHFNIR